MHVERPIRRIVRELIPRPNGEIKIVLAAAGASVLHQHSDAIASASNPVIASSVGSLDPAPAVRARGLVLLPIIANGDDESAVGVGNSAGAGAALLRKDGSDTVVASRTRV